MTTARRISFFFFFNDTATTEIYTLSLHDALPILDLPLPDSNALARLVPERPGIVLKRLLQAPISPKDGEKSLIETEGRSEEHTSELQSLRHLVCRLLLENKKKQVRAHGNGREQAD